MCLWICRQEAHLLRPPCHARDLHTRGQLCTHALCLLLFALPASITAPSLELSLGSGAEEMLSKTAPSKNVLGLLK